ncbi:MAG: DJ-1/PfpI family protein [Puniceicoccales bacterium]|jgi:4-methyl-5(b-hydroxyethyl)-thiazole monophosphate biosynthesis|nr:DJ-1/PfpI family protein [Puniceicoccales bacterium]
MGKKLCLLLADGVEEMEAVTSWDILRRAGLSVVAAAVGESCTVMGSHGIFIGADLLLPTVAAEKFDGLVLPGGPASFSLRKDVAVLALVRKMAKKFLAAICAAPLILLDAGVLDGRRHTAHFSILRELPLAEKSAVVVDENLITANGPGAAIPFALAIVRHFLGQESADAVARAIALGPDQVGTVAG